MIDDQELLFVVNENNQVLEPKPRAEAHSKGYWHRTSHIWVINSKNQILCQKRSMLKDSFPGFWESFFGGHVEAGQEYVDTAVSELNEELGIRTAENDLIPYKIYKSEPDKEFQSVYKFEWNGEISKLNFEKDEVDELKWLDINQLKTVVLEDKNLRWVYKGYMEEIFNWLQDKSN